MKKLKRINAGHYYIPGFNEIHIYKINRNLWGWCIDRGMTKGTAATLRELKRLFI